MHWQAGLFPQHRLRENRLVALTAQHTHMNKLKVEWESGSSVLLACVCSHCSLIAVAATACSACGSSVVTAHSSTGGSGVGMSACVTSGCSDGRREVYWATRQSQGRRKGSTVRGK